MHYILHYDGSSNLTGHGIRSDKLRAWLWGICNLGTEIHRGGRRGPWHVWRIRHPGKGSVRPGRGTARNHHLEDPKNSKNTLNPDVDGNRRTGMI